MLNLDKLEMVQDAHIKQLLIEFRKVQVSKYPIVMDVSMGGAIGFIDSRLPTDRFSADTMAALLYIDHSKDKPTYIIESRLVQNEKYARHNSDYHTRQTNDVKKLFKYMKEYIKPFTAQEIALMSFRSADNAFDEWKNDQYRNFRRSMQYDAEDIMEEVSKLKAMGVQPQTEKFKNIYTVGLDNYQAYKETKGKKFSRISVFINPVDESVTVTPMSGADAGVYEYESMDKAPTWVQEQVGLLKMMDSTKYVANVGVRPRKNMFWVEGLPQ